MSGFNAQTLINTAAAAKCVEIAESDFTQQYKSIIKNSYVVPNIMSPEQEAVLTALIKIPFVTDKSKPAVTNDHPVLHAARSLIRQDYHHQYQIDSLASRTLVVGSSAREIFEYNQRSNFDFYFHMSEGKDVDRTVVSLIEEIIKITNMLSILIILGLIGIFAVCCAVLVFCMPAILIFGGIFLVPLSVLVAPKISLLQYVFDFFGMFLKLNTIQQISKTTEQQYICPSKQKRKN